MARAFLTQSLGRLSACAVLACVLALALVLGCAHPASAARTMTNDQIMALIRGAFDKESFEKGLEAIMRDKEPAPVRGIEELAIKDPDRSGWEALCGAYDYAIGEFRINEIFMKDGALYARASEDETAYTLRLYPLGSNTFGIRDLDADLVFGDGTLTLYGVTGNKLGEREEEAE